MWESISWLLVAAVIGSAAVFRLIESKTGMSKRILRRMGLRKYWQRMVFNAMITIVMMAILRLIPGLDEDISFGVSLGFFLGVFSPLSLDDEPDDKNKKE